MKTTETNPGSIITNYLITILFYKINGVNRLILINLKNILIIRYYPQTLIIQIYI